MYEDDDDAVLTMLAMILPLIGDQYSDVVVGDAFDDVGIDDSGVVDDDNDYDVANNKI